MSEWKHNKGKGMKEGKWKDELYSLLYGTEIKCSLQTKVSMGSLTYMML